MRGRSYAGTTSYLVELQALALFPQDLCISNMEILHERISALGPYYEFGDPRGHPGYRGGSARRIKPADDLGCVGPTD